MRQPDLTQRRYLVKRIAAMGGIWIFACVFLWQAFEIGPPSRPTPVAAGTFPTIVGFAMVIAATGMLVGAIWTYYRFARPVADVEGSNPGSGDPLVAAAVEEEEGLGDSGPNGEETVVSWPRFLIALGGVAAYVFLFFPLGYLISTVLFLVGTFIYFWRRPVWSIVIAVVLTVAIGWLFSLLGITLPHGLLALPF